MTLPARARGPEHSSGRRVLRTRWSRIRADVTVVEGKDTELPAEASTALRLALRLRRAADAARWPAHRIPDSLHNISTFCPERPTLFFCFGVLKTSVLTQVRNDQGLQ